MKLQLIKKGWNTSRERGTVETYLDQSIKDSRGIEGLFDSGYQRMQGVKYKHLSDRKREGEKYICYKKWLKDCSGQRLLLGGPEMKSKDVAQYVMWSIVIWDGAARFAKKKSEESSKCFRFKYWKWIDFRKIKENTCKSKKSRNKFRVHRSQTSLGRIKSGNYKINTWIPP